ncbi:hypothetical protein BDM02DRAFT_609810 [Thelephora ganbajun]|uniref:Uncharacterized protein n=1 Tax=Thelephora ganbajun TaxID=370292 RepID=A0ACB6Z7X0_THEGA|nr:hypothetical protein BDM02DRAFT_609810 [Thelephora ganbajun]
MFSTEMRYSTPVIPCEYVSLCSNVTVSDLRKLYVSEFRAQRGDVPISVKLSLMIIFGKFGGSQASSFELQVRPLRDGDPAGMRSFHPGLTEPVTRTLPTLTARFPRGKCRRVREAVVEQSRPGVKRWGMRPRYDYSGRSTTRRSYGFAGKGLLLHRMPPHYRSRHGMELENDFGSMVIQVFHGHTIIDPPVGTYR